MQGTVHGQLSQTMPRRVYPTAPPLQRILFKDVNGDLKPDLVLLLGSLPDFTGPDSVVAFVNTGVAPFFDYSQPLRFPIPGGGTTFTASDLAIADLNNDGLNMDGVLAPGVRQTQALDQVFSHAAW